VRLRQIRIAEHAHVCLLQGTSGRKVGELRGHTSSVSHISLDPVHNHIFTLSLDKSIKVRHALHDNVGSKSRKIVCVAAVAMAANWLKPTTP
jgi:hypothetical protein